MASVTFAAEQRVVLYDVRWETYLALLEDVDGRRGRMAYDQGILEITSPSKLHENTGKLIGRMVEAFTEERGIEICSVKSTTFKRPDQLRGFEADESHYIANAAAVGSKEEIDLAIDPPPDLAIEVDISRSSMRKFGIYGGLGVPEVWRYVGQTLFVYVHRQADQYDQVSQSAVLPGFPLDQLSRLLDQRESLGENELVRRFRATVRARDADRR